MKYIRDGYVVVKEEGVGPFVWSPGDVALEANESFDDLEAVWRRRYRDGRFEYLSEWELLRAGWVFPVPLPTD